MKTFSDWYIENNDDNLSLFEMTGVIPKDSGLDHHIWVSHRGNTKHGIRIKVSNVPGRFANDDNFSMTVHHESPQVVSGICKLKPKHLKKIKQWIIKNHDALQKIWDDDTLGGRDHLNMIQRLDEDYEE